MFKLISAAAASALLIASPGLASEQWWYAKNSGKNDFSCHPGKDGSIYFSPDVLLEKTEFIWAPEVKKYGDTMVTVTIHNGDGGIADIYFFHSREECEKIMQSAKENIEKTK